MSSDRFRESFRLTAVHWTSYILVYFAIGTLMNQAGHWLQIARFTYWWPTISIGSGYFKGIDR